MYHVRLIHLVWAQIICAPNCKLEFTVGSKSVCKAGKKVLIRDAKKILTHVELLKVPFDLQCDGNSNDPVRPSGNI